MQNILYEIHRSSKNIHSFKVSATLNQDQHLYNITFKIIPSLDYAWSISHNFNYSAVKNWNLWQFDVTEVFWQIREHPKDFSAPYFEWQLTPNNFSFCLNINRPRISYYTPLKCPVNFSSKLHFSSNQSLAPSYWLATFSIPKLLCPPGKIVALGLFAVLGKENEKSYFSLINKATEKPDFHRPQDFILLSKLT